jgi:hypothetical protein
MVTQDFALMLHCQDDYRMLLAWTDYNAYYVESCLMSLWLLAGGNVLFGWGRKAPRTRWLHLIWKSSLTTQRTTATMRPL